MTFEGEIGEIDLIARLVELGREQFTGAIRFESDGIIKIVYFKGGDVLSASTNDRTDSIDEILLRAGKVTREHVKQALAKRKETETLGDALLNLGFITRKELTWARRVQVIGILRSIGAWATGSFTIVADYLPKRDEGTVFPLQQILVELIVTDPDRAKFEQLLEGGTAVFTKAPDFDASFRRLGLNEDAAEIVSHVDGMNSASDVAALSGKDAFNVYKLLHALRAIGLITGRDAAKAQVTNEVSQDDFASFAVSDAADMWGTPEPVAAPAPAAPPANSFDDDFDPLTPDPSPELAFDDGPSLGLGEVDPELPVPPSSASIADDMPSWDAPASPRAAAPKEEFGGFDEAQIETARRAAVPVRSPLADDEPVALPISPEPRPKKSNPLRAVWLAVVLAGVAYGGFLGWNWWQERQASAAAPPPSTAGMKPRQRIVPPTPANPAMSTDTATTSATPATASAASATTAATGSVSPLTTTSTHGSAVTTGTTGTSVATTTASPSMNTTGTAAAAKGPMTTATLPPVKTTATTPAKSPANAPAKPLVVAAVAPPRTTPATNTRTAATPGRPAPAGSSTHLERTGNGSATITNTAATSTAAASSATRTATGVDPQRETFDRQAREHAANPAGVYTVQFELVCETSSLAKAVKEGGSTVWFVPAAYHGKSCYRVFWGRYATREEALKASADVPASLREAAPVVIRIPRS